MPQSNARRSSVKGRDPGQAFRNATPVIKRAFLAVTCLALIGADASASFDPHAQRSPKQREKRVAEQMAISPTDASALVGTNDDPMNELVLMSTDAVYTPRGAFSDRVRADNFFRAFVDRKTGGASYQLYQQITYSGEWRHFDRANAMMADGLHTFELVPISRDVDTCQYGVCVNTEVLGVSLSEGDMKAISAMSSASPAALLTLRFKSNTGLDWDDEIAPAEAKGLLLAVDKWRRTHGLLVPE